MFGCTIVFGRQSLADSLLEIAQLGLLNFRGNASNNNIIPGSEINNIYLSKRETECLRHYVQGKTAKEISQIVNLSRRTVENYIYNIKIKLNVSTKAELIFKAIDYFRR